MTYTRPPRPSSLHYWDRESRSWVSRKDIEEARNTLLTDKAPEFVDIEPVEGPHLAAAGHVKSVALWEAKRALGVEGQVEVHDVLDSENPLVDWPNSDRARVYHAAETVVAEAMRQGLPEKTIYVWQLFALGKGDRTVIKWAWEERNYDLTRYEVRKMANEFWPLVRLTLVEHGE